MNTARTPFKSAVKNMALTLCLATAIGASATTAQAQPSYQPLADPGNAPLLPAIPSNNTYGNGAGNAGVSSSSGGTTPAARQPLSDAPAGAPAIVATTTNGIDGYHVRRYLGVVRGIKVFQPTIGQNFRAGLKGIIGGNISSYSEMIEKARGEAYDQLLARSTALGANAVIGLHYDSSAFGVGGSSEMGTEVICYGTAVYLEADH
jgi:uncharacterized protein YbjQ (UPF0145 family)